MDWVNATIQGILLGGLYALYAAGLSLMFGVMRLVNIAHGDLIVLGAYAALAVVSFSGLDPLWTLLIVPPLMAVAGYVLQRVLLNKTLGHDILPPLLVTFGLSIIIQNLLLELYSADSQRLQTSTIFQGGTSLQIVDGLSVGTLDVLVFASAVVVIGALQMFFYRTALGRVMRATSDDQDTVRLMGANNAKVFAYATAIAMATVAIAGIYFGMRTSFAPADGPARLLYAFEAVIIGGLGNLWGTLAGGIILGLSQTLGAEAFGPAYRVLSGHIVFLIVLILRPQGLFPRTKD